MSVEPPALPRFSAAERWVHRSTAALTGVLLVTGSTLLIGSLSLWVGNRAIVAGVHVAAGLALPLPTLLGLASPAFRADLGRLNRFRPGDWEWLGRWDRRARGGAVGKFNAGQKLAAAMIAGMALVLLGTGVLMLGPHQLGVAVNVPDRWRRTATWVHDLLAYGLLAIVLGHSWEAYRHPGARRAMRTGLMPAAVARADHGAWYAEAGPPDDAR